MAKNRLELQTLLESILGSRNVYFQPPENKKLKYPCITYELADIDTRKADDIKYLKFKRYTVTLIHSDPDNVLVDALDDLEYCEFDRVFISDNLYHYVYTLYF